ncbi:phosphatidate cytidylyltransferase [Gracilibacillus boraciitolerans JCM 21714]|uniref:Phosphatidate cytidylyltransferase n=1 Tax=Gracilibacillus boraciitolerans JCM 21714 TaxID=1298598 RepID=W4VNA2_9BACI|nr:phosphatidate cytidylyltransferase [Gracilibacillus boraciitolerans JCM 21714]
MAGFFGSVTISVLKRDLLIGNNKNIESVKDRYLNRIDSLSYTAPRYFFMSFAIFLNSCNQRHAHL